MATRIQIDTSKIRGLSDKLRRANNELQVGWFPGANYDSGTPVAGVAAAQEFGTKTAPARPFMRPAIAENKDKWAELYLQGAKQWLSGNLDYVSVLRGVGLQAEGDIKNQIVSGNHEPLSPITLAIRNLKNKNVPIGKRTIGMVAAAIAEGKTGPGELGQPYGNDTPLNDTGLMIASLTHEVS